MASSTEAIGSNGAADPFIGSLISLTSKCEIRYEGILYNINTEESSIGLINVKSYGTEGRKKDGQQVPPSDKVYEYILFRGSNIKDLQVKASPPVQSALPIQNDPAIMQSQYSRAPPVSTSLPSAASGSVADPSSHTTQIAVPRSTLQGDVPLYQPGGSLGSWGSSPSNVDGSGLAMPMYWPGFYGPSNGFSHAQQSFFQSPSGMSMPHSMQHPTYPGGSAPILTGSSYLPASSMTASNLPAPNVPASNLGESTPPLLPPFSVDSVNLASSSPQYTLLYPALHTAVASAVSPSPESNLASSTVTMPAPIAPDSNAGLRPFYPHLYTPAQHAAMFSLTSQSQMSNMASNIVPSTILPCASLPLASQPTSSALDKTSPILSLPFQTMPHSASPFVGTFGSVNTETSKPSLVTPGQLLHPGPTTLSSSVLSDPVKKDVEVVQATSSKSPPSALVIAQVPSTSSSVTTQAPILPLPSPANQKLNGPPFHTHNSHTGRVRERGRGNGFSRPVTRFTEDFDFMAMNEKFKKDEVWGDLGKANKTKYNEDHGIEDDGNISEAATDTESLKLEKPVYVKDDFFDSLSCRSLNNGQRNGRFKFSEQRKIDSETFGNVPRHWGGRGGWWPGSGGRSRGPHYGRGYGNVGRGQGY